MKVTAYILLLYFSLLGIKPLTPLIQQAFTGKADKECTMTCCHKAHKKDTHKLPANNCCNNDMCNPFGQYACCIGFLVEGRGSVPFISGNMKSEIVSSYNFIVRNYSSDCWRPPENTVA